MVGLAPWMGVAPGLCAVEDSLGLSMEWPDIPALEGVQVDGRRDPDGAIDRGDPEESFENLEYLITFYLDGLPRLYNIFAAVAEYRRSRALTVPYLSVPSDGGPGKWELKPTEYVRLSRSVTPSCGQPGGIYRISPGCSSTSMMASNAPTCFKSL